MRLSEPEDDLLFTVFTLYDPVLTFCCVFVQESSLHSIGTVITTYVFVSAYVRVFLVVTQFSSPVTSSFTLLAFDVKRKYIPLVGTITKERSVKNRFSILRTNLIAFTE